MEVCGCMDAVTDDFVPFLHHQLGSVFNLWRITGMLFYWCMVRSVGEQREAIWDTIQNRKEQGHTWASCQIRKIAGCTCAGNAGNVFLTYRLQRKPQVSDPGMHHGTCVTHVPWCMSESLIRGRGENVPGIPGACATRNFAYLARGPYLLYGHGSVLS